MRYSYAATVEAANFPLFFKVAEETYVLKVDVETHRPGTMALPGAAVSEADEMNPMNLLVRVNDDNDDRGPTGWKDNGDTSIGSNDDDIAKVVMASPGANVGTMEFTVTPASKVHVFIPDALALGGTRLVDCAFTTPSDTLLCSVNLASPAGDLAGLATPGGVNLYLEGVAPAADLTLRLVYKNAAGVEVASDEAHLGVIKIMLTCDGSEVQEDGIVYVSGVPSMPQLGARLMPDGLAGSVDWSLETVFDRPSRNDSDTLTKPSLAYNVIWDIAQQLGAGFYGGKATLRATYQSFTFREVFHIRGNNPAEATVEAEIGDAPFYARAIARHESGIQNNRTYLQFNEVGTLGPDYLTNLRNTPNRSSDQIGWGIYQVTNPAPSRNQVWNWRENVAAGRALMNSNLNEAPRYFEAIQRAYPTQYEAPPANYTAPGTTTVLTYIQAAAIQMFNGSSVVQFLPNATPPGGSSYYRSCWRFYPNNASGQRWAFVPNVNDYVTLIMEEYEAR